MKPICNASLIVEKLWIGTEEGAKVAILCLHQKIFGRLLKMTKHQDHAKEVFQRITIIIWEKVTSEAFMFEGESQFFSYVHTTSFRVWNKMLNKQDNNTDPIDGEEIQDPSDEERIIRQIQEDFAFQACYDQLDQRGQQIMDLRAKGLSFKAIALRLGEADSENDDRAGDAVRNKHQRDRTFMKKCVKKYLD